MQTIHLVTDKSSCCGCGACNDVCPAKAIEMTQDDFGFLFPKINEEKCVHCKRCLSVCQYHAKVERNSPLQSYAAACGDDDVLMHSASGGCFYALADAFLQEGGAVIGCAYENRDGRLMVHHTVAQNAANLRRLQGSKYVQSNTAGIYEQVRTFADRDVPVLFSGTPCQVAACKRFLGKEYNHVLFVDIICHGVPSLKLFQDYVACLEKKRNVRIKEIVFRDKTKGWDLKGSITYEKGNGVYSKSFMTGASSYYSLFLKGQTYRESCYSCPYAGQDRCGDITLGDYWGIEKAHPRYLKANGGRLDEKKGISCLLVNTDRGREFIGKYARNMVLLPSEFERVALYNAQLKHPSQKGESRDAIMGIISTQGYEALEKWYYDQIGMKKYVYKIYDLLPPQRRNG